MKDYGKFTEDSLIVLKQEREIYVKSMLLLEVVMSIFFIIAAVGFFIIGGSLMETKRRYGTACITLGVVNVFGCAFIGLWIERIAGYYKCKACGNCYVPTCKAVLFAPHIGRTRYMACPRCGKRSWQKKVLTKES